MSVTVPSDNCKLVVLGDLHYGSEDQDRKKIKESIKYVLETENCYAVSIGDNLDLATASSFGVIGKTPDQQLAVEQMAHDFRPLVEAGKLIGFLEGNHDRRILKSTRANLDLTQILVNEWNEVYKQNIQYGQPVLLVKINVDRDNKKDKDSFLVCLHHGAGGGGQTGSAANWMVKMRNVIVDADAYVQGHHHKPILHYGGILQSNNSGGVGEKRQVFATVGGHVKNAEYAQEKMLAWHPNLDLCLHFIGRKHRGEKKEIKATFF